MSRVVRVRVPAATPLRRLVQREYAWFTPMRSGFDSLAADLVEHRPPGWGHASDKRGALGSTPRCSTSRIRRRAVKSLPCHGRERGSESRRVRLVELAGRGRRELRPAVEEGRATPSLGTTRTRGGTPSLAPKGCDRRQGGAEAGPGLRAQMDGRSRQKPAYRLRLTSRRRCATLSGRPMVRDQPPFVRPVAAFDSLIGLQAPQMLRAACQPSKLDDRVQLPGGAPDHPKRCRLRTGLPGRRSGFESRRVVLQSGLTA